MFSKIDKFSEMTKKALKNYNNLFEKIIEDKEFEEDVKNLLLSMLYKIENAYQDYLEVKRFVPEKNDFIEDIFNIIKKKCDDIELLNVHENNKGRVEKGKIISEQIEKKMLYHIYELDNLDKKIKLQKENVDLEKIKGISKNYVISMGRQINSSEVIRDFNGWSWKISIEEIEDIKCNLIYQIMMILEKKEPNFETEYKDINDCAIKIAISIFKEKELVVENWINERKDKLEKEIDLLKDNARYVENMAEEKKNVSKKIKELDELLGNYELLKQKYVEENKKLPNEKKIFSVSRYEEIVQKEREDLLKELKEYNNMLNPKMFVENKKKKKEEYDYLLSIEDNNYKILQKLFLENLCKQIDKIENEKKDLIEYLYAIRYYSFLPYSKQKRVKDIIKLEEIEEFIIKKSINIGLLEKITPIEELNIEILKQLFLIKIANLKDINIEIELKDKSIICKMYDDQILETEYEISIKEEWREKLIKSKLNKKIKILL